MTDEPSAVRQDYLHSDAFLRRLMRRQLLLSVACAAAFVVVLLGLPLLNYFVPELMARRVAGFPLTWLLLGVLFIPFVWVISAVFIRKSLRMEDEEAAEARNRNSTIDPPGNSR